MKRLRGERDGPQAICSFDVGDWMRQDQQQPREVKATRPQQLNCWTKKSIREESQGSLYCYGSTAGGYGFAQALHAPCLIHECIGCYITASHWRMLPLKQLDGQLLYAGHTPCAPADDHMQAAN